MTDIQRIIKNMSDTLKNFGERIRKLEVRDAVSGDVYMYGHNIQDEGVPLPDRKIMDFQGSGVTASDDVLNIKTIVQIPGPYRIWVLHRNGSDAQDFDVTNAGLTAALAVSVSGDIVYVPPVILTNSFTVPAGVILSGYSTMATIFTGQITLSDNSFLRYVSVTRTESGSGEFIGIVGPATGHIYIDTVSVVITQNGSGDAIALDVGDGKLDSRNSYFYAIANSGIGIGVRTGAEDAVNFYSCIIDGESTSGSGYGIKTATGSPYMDSGWLKGSTFPATGTPVEGLYFGDAVLISASMTRLENEYNSDFVSGRFVLTNQLVGYVFDGSVATGWDHLQISGNDPNSITGSGTIGQTGYYAFASTMYFGPAYTWEQIIEAMAPEATYKQSASLSIAYTTGVEVGYSFRIFGFKYSGPPDVAGGGGVANLKPIYYGTPDVADTNLRTNAVRMDVPPVGIPVWSDRSAWDVLNYSDRHAYDIDAGIGQYHLPQGTNIGDILVWNGSVWAVQAGGPTYEQLTDDDVATLLDDDSSVLQEA